MQIIIIILLVVIIIILCPAILGVTIVAIATLISLLIKLAVPLIILFILLLALTILYKKTKTKSLLLQRLIIYLSVFLVLVVAAILNISEAFFLSYLVIFSTLIFYIIKCKESKDFITLNILLGLICFLWGFAIGLEYNILFGNVEIERELPSVVTLVLLAIPFISLFGLIPYMFPKKWDGPYIPGDTKLFIKEHIKLELFFLIIFIIGIVCGVILLEIHLMLVQGVHDNSY